MSTTLGIDLPVLDFADAAVYLNSLAEKILTAIEPGASPFVLWEKDNRIYEDSDRGQTWLAGRDFQFYKKGSYQYRMEHSWTVDPRTDSVSFYILDLCPPHRYVVSGHYKKSALSMPHVEEGNFVVIIDRVFSDANWQAVRNILTGKSDHQ